MNKTHLFLIASTLLFAGCGKDLNGTYTGTETYQNMGTGQSQSGPVTITVAKDGEEVNWISQYGSGQGKGMKASDSTITGTMAITDTMMSGFGGFGGSGASTNYMMTITVGDNDDLTANGVGTGVNQPTGGQQMPMMSQGGSRNATAKKNK